jgi:hypothetical protein
VPSRRTDETLLRIYKTQKSFPFTAAIHIFILAIFGVLIAYVGILLIVVSLFNPILFIITIGVEIRYITWSVRNVKEHIKKVGIKKVKKWLEK